MKQVYKCFIKTISPVHIGCDEVYEPMGFVVDEQQKKLIAFDPIKFIGQLSKEDKQKFSTICSKGTLESILEIYKFLRRKTAGGNAVQLCDGFIKHYNKTLGLSTTNRKTLQQELGRFVIYRTSFLAADSRPYIPGTSLKGSLRTAYLNSLVKNRPGSTPSGKNAAKELEKKLLSYADIPTDPFRLVKVSDFMPVGAVQTRIFYAVNIKKGSGVTARGPFQIVETILPGQIFSGTIVVEQPLAGAPIDKPIQLNALLSGCTGFYSSEYAREKEELKTAGTSALQEPLGENAIPIRLGRHSGAESITIAGHRSIKIMGKRGEKPRTLDHATTLWLAGDESKPRSAAGCVPFGWAALCESLTEHEEDFTDKEQLWLQAEANSSGTTAPGHSAVENVAGPSIKPPEPETWENAILLYAPNTGTVSARIDNKNATAKTIDVVPVPLLETLKNRKKKKTVTATVIVEHIGGREYRLLEIKT